MGHFAAGKLTIDNVYINQVFAIVMLDGKDRCSMFEGGEDGEPNGFAFVSRYLPYLQGGTIYFFLENCHLTR